MALDSEYEKHTIICDKLKGKKNSEQLKQSLVSILLQFSGTVLERQTPFLQKIFHDDGVAECPHFFFKS